MNIIKHLKNPIGLSIYGPGNLTCQVGWGVGHGHDVTPGHHPWDFLARTVARIATFFLRDSVKFCRRQKLGVGGEWNRHFKEEYDTIYNVTIYLDLPRGAEWMALKICNPSSKLDHVQPQVSR